MITLSKLQFWGLIAIAVFFLLAGLVVTASLTLRAGAIEAQYFDLAERNMHLNRLLSISFLTNTVGDTEEERHAWLKSAEKILSSDASTRELRQGVGGSLFGSRYITAGQLRSFVDSQVEELRSMVDEAKRK